MEEATCCTECFGDLVIQEYIQENGVDGDCQRCGSEEVKLVSPGDLTEMFEPLVGLYMISAVGRDRLTSDEPFDSTPLLDCIEQTMGTFFSEGLEVADNCRSLFEDIVNYHRLRGDPKDEEWLDLDDAWVPRTKSFSHRSVEDLWKYYSWHLQHERRFIPDESDGEIIPPQDWLPEFLDDLTVSIETNA